MFVRDIVHKVKPKIPKGKYMDIYKKFKEPGPDMRFENFEEILK